MFRLQQTSLHKGLEKLSENGKKKWLQYIENSARSNDAVNKQTNKRQAFTGETDFIYSISK